MRLMRAADVNTYRQTQGRPLLRPGTVIVSKTLAARFGLNAGDVVEMRRGEEVHGFEVIDITDDIGFFAENAPYADLKSYAVFSDTPRPKGGASSGRWAPQTTPCSETTCPSAEEGMSIGGTPPNPLKHIQLRPISLRVLMRADVLLHHVRGDLISYGAGKIPILPERLFPSRLLQLWKFSQETTRGNTLQNPYDFGNRILGGKTQQDMDVVLRDLHCTDFEPKVLGDGAEECSRTLADIRPYNPPAILRGPNQMICCVIDGMTRTFESHVTMLAHDPPACGRPNFSSPPKGRGFQVRA